MTCTDITNGNIYNIDERACINGTIQYCTPTGWQDTKVDCNYMLAVPVVAFGIFAPITYLVGREIVKYLGIK